MKFNKIINILEQEERSKAWLARKIKVSPSLLVLMLQGKRTFQETYKNKICQVFNMDYKELF
jgi:DNA-binding XRE family transcriptional regulator|tara:strand:+ start:278 stop:463 length:186 start_codon:yes stop_codon:yes gene_type:complete